jgi:hypothetical protein
VISLAGVLMLAPFAAWQSPAGRAQAAGRACVTARPGDCLPVGVHTAGKQPRLHECISYCLFVRAEHGSLDPAARWLSVALYHGVGVATILGGVRLATRPTRAPDVK